MRRRGAWCGGRAGCAWAEDDGELAAPPRTSQRRPFPSAIPGCGETDLMNGWRNFASPDSKQAAARDSGAQAPSRLKITVFPMTSRYIFVIRQQSNAFLCFETTGSFSLKDVLSTIGMPVRARKL